MATYPSSNSLPNNSYIITQAKTRKYLYITEINIEDYAKYCCTTNLNMENGYYDFGYLTRGNKKLQLAITVQPL